MALLARCTTAIRLVAALIDCGADSRPGPSKQPPNVAGWRTVWADEFDGSAIPDSTISGWYGGHGWGTSGVDGSSAAGCRSYVANRCER